MLDTLIPFFFVCVCTVLLFGALLLAEAKHTIWRWGIFIGMGGSGLSAFAFLLLPYYETYPCTLFITAIMVMLGCVVWSYYRAPTPDSYTDEQRQSALEQKHDAARYMLIGLGFSLILMVVVGIIQNQQQGTRVQRGFAGVVYQLAEEVKSLHQAVNTLTRKVNDLEGKAMEGAIKDSIARKKNFQNQEIIKQNTTPKRKR